MRSTDGGGWMVDGAGAAGKQALLLCERALWPGEANAQPPVGRQLIGGASGRAATPGELRCLLRAVVLTDSAV